MGTYLIAAWYSPHNWPYIAIAILGLGMVIFVHELGHFVVAKLCGVKCEKFYIGFDVPIKLGWGRFGIKLPASLWKKQWGETLYGIGIIPLGGYVKMLGQDDNPARHAEMMKEAKEQEAAGGSADQTDSTGDAGTQSADQGEAANENYVLDPRSYMAKSVPARIAIISAGVIMNVIFAFIFAMVAYGIGVPYTKCQVLTTVPGQPAWDANLRPRDEIKKINDVEDPLWKELRQEVILARRGRGISLVIARQDAKGDIRLIEQSLTPKQGKMIQMIGISPMTTLKLEQEQPAYPFTPAGRIKDKLQAGDEMTAVNGVAITDIAAYHAILARSFDKKLTVTFKRKISEDESTGAFVTKDVTIDVEPFRLRRFGLVMRAEPIEEVQPGSPADKAGINEGDRIVSFDGAAFKDPLLLPQQAQARAGKTVEIEVERQVDGKPKRITLSATLRDADWFFIWGKLVEVPALGIAYPVSNTIDQIATGMPAENSGLKPGDRITTVRLVPSEENYDKEKETFGKLRAWNLEGKKKDLGWSSFLLSVQRALPGTKVEFTIERNGKEETFEIGLVESADTYVPDRGFHFVLDTDVLEVTSFGQAASRAWRETKYQVLGVYRFLHKLVWREVSPFGLAGPGTIATVASMSAKQGTAKFLIFLTLLSANLAVINILPIPVLDGGHLVFLILEAIFRRPVSERIVIPLTYLGLFFILGLMMFVIWLDVDRLLLN